MDAKAFMDASSTLSAMIEQVSNIEKFHRRIKTGRFIGTNLIFTISHFAVFSCCYLLRELAGRHSTGVMFTIFLFFTFLLWMLISNIKSMSESKIVGSIALHLTILMFNLLLLTILYSYFYGIIFGGNELHYEDSGAIALVVLIFGLLNYIFYDTSRMLGETIVKGMLIKSLLAHMLLITGDKISGRLVTITRKGDYVIVDDIDEIEILIKLNNVVSVKFTQIIQLD